MKTKKIFNMIAIAISIMMVLGACSSGDSDAGNTSTDGEQTSGLPYEGKLITYCPPTLSDPFLAATAEKIEQYATELGMEFVATEGNFDIATQIQQIENFVTMGSDLIIAQPVDVAAYETVIAKAREMDVKVMFIADDPTYDVEGSFMSVEQVQGEMVGQMASAWIDETFPDAGEGEIKVALLQNIDRPSTQVRCDAIKDTILADPRCTVVFEKAGIPGSDDAQTAVDEALALDREINLVLTFDEVQAIGANASIMANTSLDKSKIAVFGGNLTDAGVSLIEDSETDASVVRGLVSFGEGDAYYEDMVAAICSILDEEVPVNTPFFAQHIAVNSVGYESSFDPAEYAETYVDTK